MELESDHEFEVGYAIVLGLVLRVGHVSYSLSFLPFLSLSLSLLSNSRTIFVGGLHYMTTWGTFFLPLRCAVRMYTI